MEKLTVSPSSDFICKQFGIMRSSRPLIGSALALSQLDLRLTYNSWFQIYKYGPWDMVTRPSFMEERAIRSIVLVAPSH